VNGDTFTEQLTQMGYDWFHDTCKTKSKSSEEIL